MRKRLDLTGQRFGKLTVLRPAENIGTCTFWVCRCDCGQETIVRTDNMRNGRTKSCGCQRRSAVVKKDVKARSVNKNNTSGACGVEWLPHNKQWKATICFNRKRYFLGCYLEFEDAVKARKQAEENLRDHILDKRDSARYQSAGDGSLAGKRKEHLPC